MNTIKKTVTLGMIFTLLSGYPVYSQHISDSIDVVHYDIELEEINTAGHTLTGLCQITFTPKTATLHHLVLHLKDLQVDAIMYDENPLEYVHTDEILSIELPGLWTPQDTGTISIAYHGSPFSENWGGFHFSQEYAFNLGVGFESIPHNLGRAWFPCVDDFIDKATYSYHIAVEAPKSAVCGGLLQGTTVKNQKTIYHWEMEEAIPAYLASVAVGEYVLYEDVYEGLEANIPIQIYVRPFELSATAGSFVNLKNILSIYENHWGPYPFSRIGYVSTAKGAMEHAANIAYPYGTINNTTDYEWLYAHELAHMWFGDKTTCSSAADMWLNEGWAVFNEFLYREGLYGTDAYKTEYREVLNDVLHYAHTPQGDGDYYALNAIPQNITYGTTVYDKGALVVHTLRNYLGDEQFFPAIQDYLQMYAYQSASSEDMEQALTTITGTDLHDFFENWVYTPGFPHFEIDSVIRQGDEQMVYVQQKGTGRDFLSSSNHIEITFMDQNRNTWSDTMMVDGRWAQKGMFPPFVPAAVFIDYHEKMSDAAFQQEALVTEPENFNLNDIFMQVDVSAENDTSLLWISHHWAAPDSLKTPIPGLRLSDYRYWKVSGIFSESFQASARFLYDKPNYLDHTLFQDEGEQITLCYRPDQSSEWQELETTQIGPDIIGFLEINNLMPGEYTMAVWEEWVTGMQQKNEKPFIIYPNPADKRATISSPCPVKNIKIYDSKGLLINSFRLNNHGIFKWDTHHLANGIYTLFINCKNGRTISQKVIIQH